MDKGKPRPKPMSEEEFKLLTSLDKDYIDKKTNDREDWV